jgi:hypothetical protein
MTPARIARLRAWVNAGGHLIVEAEQPGIDDPLLKSYGVTRVRLRMVKGELVERPHKSDPDAPHTDEEEEEAEPMDFGMDVQDMPVEGDDDSKGVTPLKLPKLRSGLPARLVLPGSHVFSVAFTPYQNLIGHNTGPRDWHVRDDIGLRMLQRQDGQGRVTMISNFDFMAARRLGKFDHAEFTWHLMVANADGSADNAIKPTLWLALRDPGGGLWASGRALARSWLKSRWRVYRCANTWWRWAATWASTTPSRRSPRRRANAS